MNTEQLEKFNNYDGTDKKQYTALSTSLGDFLDEVPGIKQLTKIETSTANTVSKPINKPIS